ncbi:MAG: SusD/RagB family nutrient-binding outer membrane lipoprotein [Alphaproteobacteria bacterium]|nr:SusD/RagB family nutrient-binding outer membrane lipoprotein [Alphaproteobacteria bacterium]
MKNKNSIIIIGFLLVGMISCSKFVEDGDVNINPNKSATVTLNTLLPGVIDATCNAQFWSAYTTSLLGQHMAAYQSGPINDDQNRDVRMSNAYRQLYQNGLNNALLLMNQAQSLGAPHYQAIASILFVINLSTATDIFGDVPYSTAFKAPEILYPTYDLQQDIYPQLNTLLYNAINLVNQTNPATLKPGTDDLIFQGDMTLWKRTAYSLLARLAIHTTKKGADSSYKKALSLLSNGFTSTTKDCQLVYNDKNFNPWAINVSNRISTGNFTIAPSKRLVDIMNGAGFYTGLVDPRLPLFFDKRTQTSYIGLQNGAGIASGNCDLTTNTYYGKNTTPLVLMSYTEQKFIEAEALFLNNGGTITSKGTTQAAYDAYLEGIRSHMAKIGVPTASITTYLTNAKVGVTKDSLTLELIMKEKNIATFLQNEAWNDVRRYDYNSSIYRGMALPLNQETTLNGEYIRRSWYPLDEINRNPNAIKSLMPLNTKVWWDQ